MNTKNDVSADKIDILKDAESQNNESNTDEVKYLEPLDKLEGISKVPVSDLKWVFNDMFLMVITAKNEVAILDGLLYAYGL